LKSFGAETHANIVAGITDLRKGFNGLSGQYMRNLPVLSAMPSRRQHCLHGPSSGVSPVRGLLARVLTSKYAEHTPLYRQSEIHGRQGVELSRSLLSG